MASRIMFFIVIVLLSTSCTSSKKITYFENATDTTFQAMLNNVESQIHPNDILNISVTSLNKAASEAFNTDFVAVGINTQFAGYLVNSDGNIQMPTLGAIAAAGLTKNQLKNRITNIILEKKLLLDPIVNIRFLNFEVTVIGEVARPTVINVPNERISLLKAIGLAGDLTIYGKRDNILLIREEDGKKITRHIDINSKDFFSSPYYYLQPNDVVYVEPNKAKRATASKSQQTVPIILSSLSIVAIILTSIIK
jgi:polysaccharide export outer membrane protein